MLQEIVSWFPEPTMATRSSAVMYLVWLGLPPLPASGSLPSALYR
jgi:hypothetical protein